jgi:hypothetical protein
MESFPGPVSYPAPGPVSFIAVADLRGNGLEDLLTTNGGGFNPNITTSIAVLYGRWDGAFGPPVPYTSGLNPAWLSMEMAPPM